MTRGTRIFFAAAVATLIAAGSVGYLAVMRTPRAIGATTSAVSCATIVTTTNATAQSTYCLTGMATSAHTTGDVFLTSCSVTGIGEFALRVISDSTGAPVTGENISAIDTLGCDVVGQGPQTQVVRISNFSAGDGGWLTPVFPGQAEPGGELNFTVTYQGRTYNFSAGVPPIGTSCVTLHVPSGNVTKISAPSCTPTATSTTLAGN